MNNNNYELKGVLNEGVTIYYQGEEASITSLTINDNGELVVELDTGTSVVVGRVVGEKGDTGLPGGFGSFSAEIESVEPGSNPAIFVEASGDNAAKDLFFSFKIPKGDKGDKGAVFTPTVSADGDLAWSNDGGLLNPTTVNIKGGKGDRGDIGYHISSIELKEGSNGQGVAGTFDTYVLKLNDPDNTIVGEFQVYNGRNGTGIGDMLLSVYDTNVDGVVDKADDSNKLGGQDPSYYASAQMIPTKTSDLTNNSGYITANDIPTTAANAEKLGGNAPSYYAVATDVPTKTSQLVNDSDFVTGADVDVKTAALVDSAPETLNTLNELAAALGDDPNFATTVAQQIGEKVPQTRKINGHALSEDFSLSASDVDADASGTASSVVSTHNSSTSAHSDLFNKKQNAPASATVLPPSGTALTNNTIYVVSAAVGTYQFVAPVSGWAHGTFTTDASVAITFASGAKFIGEAPEFVASTTYEFDVFNGVWVFAEVVAE